MSHIVFPEFKNSQLQPHQLEKYDFYHLDTHREEIEQWSWAVKRNAFFSTCFIASHFDFFLTLNPICYSRILAESSLFEPLQASELHEVAQKRSLIRQLDNHMDSIKLELNELSSRIEEFDNALLLNYDQNVVDQLNTSMAEYASRIGCRVNTRYGVTSFIKKLEKEIASLATEKHQLLVELNKIRTPKHVSNRFRWSTAIHVTNFPVHPNYEEILKKLSIQ